MKSDLENLIEELETETWKMPEIPEADLPDVPRVPYPWPGISVDAERRFERAHARLFPFIGRKVRTPAGTGTLIQVFSGRVTVLLESNMDKCAFLRPSEIEPVNWELP